LPFDILINFYIFVHLLPKLDILYLPNIASLPISLNLIVNQPVTILPACGRHEELLRNRPVSGWWKVEIESQLEGIVDENWIRGLEGGRSGGKTMISVNTNQPRRSIRL
jgi:hypothetical protein